jgi:MFS family permease
VNNKIIFSERGMFLYGWVIVAVSILVMIGLGGAELSFGVFLKPIQEEFGWTRTMVSGAVSIVEGVCGLVGIVIGRLADKHGPRMTIAICALIGGLGCLLMSQTRSLWQLYLYFGVMVGVCIAGWISVFAAVSRRFVDKRVLALGITSSGITIGQMFLPPVLAYFIISYEWRLAFVILAVIVWISAIPALILLEKNPPQGRRVLCDNWNERDRTEHKGRRLTEPRQYAVTEAVKMVQFWMLIITGFVIAVGFYVVTIHIVAYATDIGIATTSAALVLTIMSIANILGRLLVAPLAIKVGGRFTLFLLLALQALALFLLMWASNLWMLFALAAVFGFGFGGTSPIRMSMIPEFFGVRSVGAIMGTVGVAWAVGGITGPILAGYIFDVSHSYDMAFLAGGLLLIIGMTTTYFLKVPKVSDGSLEGGGND